MSKETYLERIDRVRARPDLARMLVWENKVLTTVGYIAYPLLLVLEALFAPGLLARTIAVPAAAFVVLSVVRRIYDEERPYEAWDFTPIVDKSTQGKSFPSRHTFCMFMIAFSWMLLEPLVGVVLCASGCVMAAIRVCTGVHYVRDVVAGAVAAALFALVGYVILPW